MSLEQDLRESLSQDDAEFVAAVRLRADARPLQEETTVIVHGPALARLVALGEEALQRRVAMSTANAVQIGAKGRLVTLNDGDELARLSAVIVFDNECELRRAGAFIATEVSIEPLIETPTAANEATPGQGSLQHEEDEQ